jgi:predicted ribosomally synthesized peptide with SipW-like signal peptide
MLAAGLPSTTVTDNNNSNVTRRKLLGSMALVGVASAGAGAGTYAYISDNEEASFSFQAGSILLKTEPETVNFTEDAEAQDEGSEMKETITISNLGTLNANTLSVSNIVLDGAEDLKAGADVTTLTFTSPDGSEADLTTDPPQTLATLSNDLPLELIGDADSPLAPQGDPATLEVGITYDYSEVTTNGGMLSAGFEFTASQ